MKLFLAILAVVCFVFNSDICDMIYPGVTEQDIRSWWLLKSNIYGIGIALALQTANIGEVNKYTRLVLNIGTGLAFSNVVDRWFFNVREFRQEDYLMITLTLAFAFYEYGRKRNITTTC